MTARAAKLLVSCADRSEWDSESLLHQQQRRARWHPLPDGTTELPMCVCNTADKLPGGITTELACQCEHERMRNDQMLQSA